MSQVTSERLLAFDTSTESLAVAACGPVGEHVLNAPGGAAASAALLPGVQEVLARASLSLRDLQAVAFGCGPGAFTGLRTSCAVAQGLGLGLALPLLPIDSLLIVAEDACNSGAAAVAEGLECAVAMDARMNEIYGARYRRAGGGWQTLDAPALYTLAAWQGVLGKWGDSLVLLAGSAPAVFGERIGWAGPCVAQERDRAAALLRLARAAWHRGEALDAASALPLYLRDKVAFTTAERAATRAASAAS